MSNSDPVPPLAAPPLSMAQLNRSGYVLAMAVLQSPLWATADDELRVAVERFTLDLKEVPHAG